MTKLTLLTAASVATIAFAGAAQAGTITASIGGVTSPNGTAAIGAYTIASERTVPAAPGFTSADGAFDVNYSVLANTFTIAANAPSVTYRVTLNITGGTFRNPTLASLGVTTREGTTLALAQAAAAATAAPAATVTPVTRSATQMVFIVEVPADAANLVLVDSFVLDGTLAIGSQVSTTVGGTVEVLAGGVASVADTTSAVTLADFKALRGGLTVTSNTVLAALPDFKLFEAGAVDTVTGALANDYVLAVSSVGDTYYSDLAGTTVDLDGLIESAVLTVAGSQLTAPFTPAITTATLNAGGTASSVTFACNEACTDALIAGTPDFTLSQTGVAANQVAITPGTFTTSAQYTYAAGYTAPAATAPLTSGVINLDGVNFIAPWAGGSQSTAPSTIRISNGAASPTGNVTLRLNSARARAAGVTTGSGASIANQTCATTFTVPANGELQIGSTELFNCFGDFLRGDVQITVQSAATSLTAKMRNVQGGVATEATLGRFSGGTSTDSAF